MPDASCCGGIEAGGTRFVCATGTGADDLRALVEFPTGRPAETIARAIGFFNDARDQGADLQALGVGSFGPLELDPARSDYGHISTTPKPGWQDVDLVGQLSRGTGLPVRIDTDVNAAARAERLWGAARGLDHFLYVTVGTGIGVGAWIGGRPLHGVRHPEMGHMLLPPDPEEPAGFGGICPYHGGCAEGLASGAALVARWGRRLEELPEAHPAWRIEAAYLGTFLAALALTLQPERIVIGGGVMNPALLARVRDTLRARLAGYQRALAAPEAVEDFLVLPGLGGRAGVLGAIAMVAVPDARG
ncbi:MAG: ROK family protein [Gammaproteobacteria bacterium]|nr:ROK family protein [Gammaproteobacteria bacterium]MDH4254599.1 ROK family protein [Gammaproteobacteria bacterium]MDH5309442.1 ROK family protein [Gammaproteobacteria bacterium]